MTTESEAISFQTFVDDLLNKAVGSSRNSSSITAPEIVKEVIDVLDSNLSDLNPTVALIMAVWIPTCILLLMFVCARFDKCRCCCFCCFGRKLVPNTDARDPDDILGDEDHDANAMENQDLEAVHTDPMILNQVSVCKESDGVDDDPRPISPTTAESEYDDDDNDGNDNFDSPPISESSTHKKK